MNEDEIARGVSRGLRDYDRRRAESNGRSVMVGVLFLGAFFVGFILLVTYGG
ncbi:hypothetical protein P1P68_06130 [Streptomyces scabiei]|uniref:hypothetical protein n=1 Tax=Streptomyces scabiei TaxID=1930 RepID=UPI00298F4652|nr:hypothetical protein [Streptomyces scabiei]MDW8804381.1 hypothetical protein [Streptomyces scabiei]